MLIFLQENYQLNDSLFPTAPTVGRNYTIQMWAWISTQNFTVRVELGTYMNITDAAPIVKWSIGKQLSALYVWCNKKFDHVDLRIFDEDI